MSTRPMPNHADLLLRGLLVALALGSSGVAQDVFGPLVASDVRSPGQRELAQLGELLVTWTERAGWPHVSGGDDLHPMSNRSLGDPCPEIAARLALFETRFGECPQEVEGWGSLASLAERVHGRLLVEYPAPAAAPGNFREPWYTWSGPRWLAVRALPAAAPGNFREPWYTWSGPSWLAVRALLLDIAGRRDEARELLLGDVERYWDGCCWPDLTEDLYVLACARAEFLDRAGDGDGALLWYHEAFFACEADELADMFGRTRVAADLVLARYAMLLAAAHERAAALTVVAHLERERPGSLGLALVGDVSHDTRVAPRFTLAESEQLAPSAAGGTTLFSLDLAETEPRWRWLGRAFVVGVEADPRTWRLIAGTVERFPERKAGNRYAPDCRTDLAVVSPDDPRIATFLALAKANRERDAADTPVPASRDATR